LENGSKLQALVVFVFKGFQNVSFHVGRSPALCGQSSIALDEGDLLSIFSYYYCNDEFFTSQSFLF